MKKFLKIIFEYKYVIALTAMSIFVAISENITAYNEQFNTYMHYGVSLYYGEIYLLQIVISLGAFIFFAITLKRRKPIEFLTALFLLVTTLITLMFFINYIFSGLNPLHYYRIEYKNSVVYYFNFYESPAPGETAVWQSVEKVISLSTISAIICLLISVGSIIAAYFKKNSGVIAEAEK